MTTDLGRVASPSRFSSPTEPASRLVPAGFDPARRLEFRPDSNGEFDEIVARFADGMVHVETMSDTGCYVGFYWDDGRYCRWWISSKRKLKYSHEDGIGTPSRFTAWGIDQRPDEPLSEVARAAIAMEYEPDGSDAPIRVATQSTGETS